MEVQNQEMDMHNFSIAYVRWIGASLVRLQKPFQSGDYVNNEAIHKA